MKLTLTYLALNTTYYAFITWFGWSWILGADPALWRCAVVGLVSSVVLMVTHRITLVVGGEKKEKK